MTETTVPERECLKARGLTGPAHYRMAQERLDASDEKWLDGREEDARHEVAAAQVHATLALAAAVAMGSGRADDHGMMPEDAEAWFSACSELAL